MRDVSPALASCELTFIDRQPIDIARAAEQHAQYCDALRRAGADVQFIDPAPEQPDGVFVEDIALVLDEIAIVTFPGARSRRGEIAGVASALAGFRPLSFIRETGTLDGGDVLRAGRALFAGATARSNADGFQELAAIASRFGYTATRVAVTGCLHLKTAVTAIDETTLVINPRAVDPRIFEGHRLIEADAGEPSGADILNVGGTVLVAASAPRTRERIEQAGYRTEAVDISEFEKAEAGVTCLSLLI